jgi:hypothetical protein
VVAMLVLAFPEVHWVFLTSLGPEPGGTLDTRLFRSAHLARANRPGGSGAGLTSLFAEILRLHQQEFSPLFDSTGLRNAVRSRLGGENLPAARDQGRAAARDVPFRRALAAAVDDERPYTYFNAYCAYRFGYRCHIVSSLGMMDRLFGPENCDPPPSLAFEDLYLDFPDRASYPSGRARFSDLLERAREFPGLENASARILVTVGHHHAGGLRLWKANLAYLRRRKLSGLWSRVLVKPTSGIFDLWARSGMRRLLRRTGSLAEGFIWPPKRGDKASPDAAHTGHSAPGRLLEVATHLLRRADTVRRETSSVEDAVHGCLLALEAQELLGSRTPTTAVEALALRQQLEVSAECMFHGVEHNLDVASRFADVRREVRALGDWFNPQQRRRSELNAEINIIMRILWQFRQSNQFDEEQACLRRVRSLRRGLVLASYPLLGWPPFLLRTYVDGLVGSLRLFLAALLAWSVGLALGYSWLFWGRPDVLRGLPYALSAFFGGSSPVGLEPQIPETPALIAISILAIVAGFVHLGIFVSYLYSLIARR